MDDIYKSDGCGGDIERDQARDEVCTQPKDGAGQDGVRGSKQMSLPI